jgi:hypothetical protein
MGVHWKESRCFRGMRRSWWDLDSVIRPLLSVRTVKMFRRMIHWRHLGTSMLKTRILLLLPRTNREYKGYLSCITSQKSVARNCSREWTAIRSLISVDVTRGFTLARNPRMSRPRCPLISSTPVVFETYHCHRWAVSILKTASVGARRPYYIAIG